MSKEENKQTFCLNDRKFRLERMESKSHIDRENGSKNFFRNKKKEKQTQKKNHFLKFLI